ncbi:MAG: Lrp/AsnC family transcriptional regulator, partial [Actinomycetota bacterium]|nr:Lrp/AsnC family transcriptional regulator [Actinomycetota bacterium]
MVKAYVLIQTDTGRAADVANGIRELTGVISSEAVTGPY